MRILQRTALTLAVLFLGMSLYGQSAALRKANKQYELYAFNLAIKSYLDVVEKYPRNSEALGKLGDSYRHLNQMSQAAKWYKQAIAQPNIDPINFLNYGKVLMALGKHDEAKRMFFAYSRSFPEIGNHFAENADFAKQQTASASSGYRVSNELINSAASDFGSALYQNNRVVFSSARTDFQRTSNNWSGKSENQLFVAQKGSNGFLQNPTLLKNSLKNKYNIGPVSYSKDGRWVAYTKSNFTNGTRHIASSGMEMSLYFAEVKSNGDWGAEIAFPYNGTDYSTGYPSLSENGSTLYFASNRPDGFGGYDIFVSRRVGKTWSTPINLGATVNSLGNEITPFFDGQNLYFTSDWHQGLGGYDVFRADAENNNWVRIFNLGNGVNSSYDDYGFVYDYAMNVGYFTSNRTGGKGLEDIYRVSKTTGGIVIAVKNATDRSPISNAQVDFSPCGEGVYTTDINGIYSFQARDGLNCDVLVRKSGYSSSSLRLSTSNVQQGRSFEVLLTRTSGSTVNPANLPGASYTGKVIDSQNRQPINGVIVRATNSRTGQAQEAYSDANGNYTLKLTPNSMYIIRYSRGGYAEFNRSLQTNNGADRSILGIIPFMPAEGNTASTQTNPNTNTNPSNPYPGSSNPSSGSTQPTYPGNTTYPTTGTTTKPTHTGTSTNTHTNTDGATTTTSAPATRGYAVQVAAVSKLNMSNYGNLGTLGNVYYQNTGKVYKIRLGVYPTKEKAIAAKAKARAKGYKQAFVVEENVSAVSAVVNTNTTTTRPSTTANTSTAGSSTSGYMVRIATLRNTSNFNTQSVSSIGYIEQRQSGPYTIMLLSGYNSLSDARLAQRKVRNLGFSDAYVVVENAGKLQKVK